MSQNSESFLLVLWEGKSSQDGAEDESGIDVIFVFYSVTKAQVSLKVINFFFLSNSSDITADIQ